MQKVECTKYCFHKDYKNRLHNRLSACLDSTTKRTKLPGTFLSHLALSPHDPLQPPSPSLNHHRFPSQLKQPSRRHQPATATLADNLNPSCFSSFSSQSSSSIWLVRSAMSMPIPA
ncbi:hypothetical protein SORBI_3005G053700 [Sorghum bicolor]|uniref:Uncharacterized protein n=1 Tax=Sorghum bicolor TaxID=4558 RepID=A0A1B6PQA8_SORBI|nr:hypothetical protein SORBI_3005G053700 [Sorghum bicolor]